MISVGSDADCDAIGGRVMACGRRRLATHGQQIVGGFSVGVTPSRARPRDILLCLSAPAELAVTIPLAAREEIFLGGVFYVSRWR